MRLFTGFLPAMLFFMVLSGAITTVESQDTSCQSTCNPTGGHCITNATSSSFVCQCQTGYFGSTCNVWNLLNYPGIYGTNTLVKSTALDPLSGILYVGGVTTLQLASTPAYGGYDMFIMSVNASSGAAMYIRQYGGTSDDLLNSVVLDSQRGVGYIIGATNGFIPPATTTNAGGFDLVILRFRLSDGLQTAIDGQRYSSSADDIGMSMAISSKNIGYIWGGQAFVIYTWAYNLNVTGQGFAPIYQKPVNFLNGMAYDVAIDEATGLSYVVGRFDDRTSPTVNLIGLGAIMMVVTLADGLLQFSTSLVSTTQANSVWLQLDKKALYIAGSTLNGGFVCTMTTTGASTRTQQLDYPAFDVVYNSLTGVSTAIAYDPFTPNLPVVLVYWNTTTSRLISQTVIDGTTSAAGLTLSDQLTNTVLVAGISTLQLGFVAQIPQQNCSCGVNQICLFTSQDASLSCICSEGFSGPNCTVDVCSPNPCLHGGTCSRDASGFSCACTDPYLGPTCANSVTLLGVNGARITPGQMAADFSNNIGYMTGQASIPLSPGYVAQGPEVVLWGLNLTSHSVMWVKQFGSPVSDAGNFIKVNTSISTGYVVGFTFGVLNSQPYYGNGDCFLVSFSLTNNGSLLNTVVFGSSGSDVPYGFALDENNVAYITGSTTDSLGPAFRNFGDTDIFLIAINTATGAQVFLQQWGTVYSDSGQGVAVNSATGRGYLVGACGGVINAAPAFGRSDNIIISFLLSTGQAVYTKIWGTSQNELATALALFPPYIFVTVQTTQLPQIAVTGQVVKLSMADGSIVNRTASRMLFSPTSISVDPVTNIGNVAGTQSNPTMMMSWSFDLNTLVTTFFDTFWPALDNIQSIMDTTHNLTYAIGVDTDSYLFVAPQPTTQCTEGACRNGGVCNTTGSANGPTCTCATGYSDPFCGTNINDCLSSSICLNGGSCFDGIDSFSCQCPAGFSGLHCEVSLSSSGSSALGIGVGAGVAGGLVFLILLLLLLFVLRKRRQVKRISSSSVSNNDDGMHFEMPLFGKQLSSTPLRTAALHGPEDAILFADSSLAVSNQADLAGIHQIGAENILFVDQQSVVPNRAALAKINHVDEKAVSIFSPTDTHEEYVEYEFEKVTDAFLFATYAMDRSLLRMIRNLGKGNFGQVFLMQHIRTQEYVAAKSLQKQDDETGRAGFLAEAKLLSTFHQQNIVHLQGVCFETSPELILLEYIPYGDLQTVLRAFVKSSNEISCAEQCHMAAQIAYGMEYLASIQFVHRDLALRNCLLGYKSAVKIADFGLSRDLSRSRGEYYVAQTRGLALPIRWMALESLEFRKFTTKTDVWSFGVVLWEILTNATKRPYGTFDNNSIAKILREGKRLPQPENCPDEMYDLMLQTWSVSSDDRPTFTELRIKLEKMKTTALQSGQQIRDLGETISSQSVAPKNVGVPLYANSSDI